MTKQINLIPRITEEEQREEELNKTISLISVLTLLVTLMLIVGSFAYHFYLKSDYELIARQSRDFESELNKERVKESLLKGIESKLNRLQELYQSFPQLSRIFQDLQSLSKDNLTFTTSRIEKDGSVEFSVATTSLNTLHSFIKELKVQAETLKLSDIQITDLSSSTNSGYKTSIRFKWRGYGKS